MAGNPLTHFGVRHITPEGETYDTWIDKSDFLFTATALLLHPETPPEIRHALGTETDPTCVALYLGALLDMAIASQDAIQEALAQHQDPPPQH